MAAVRHLGLAVLALGRPEQRLAHEPRHLRLARGEERRPVGGAVARAAALAGLVLLEQVEREALAVDQDGALRALVGLQPRGVCRRRCRSRRGPERPRRPRRPRSSGVACEFSYWGEPRHAPRRGRRQSVGTPEHSSPRPRVASTSNRSLSTAMARRSRSSSPLEPHVDIAGGLAPPDQYGGRTACQVDAVAGAGMTPELAQEVADALSIRVGARRGDVVHRDRHADGS